MAKFARESVTRRGGGEGTPADAVVYVAAFVCAGTERIGREVGFPVAVIAATSDPDEHAERLTRTLHAAWTPRDGGTAPMVLDDPRGVAGEFVYRQLRFDRRWLGDASMPPGVGLRGGALTVALPPGASAGDVSSLLCSSLSEQSFEHVARRPDRVWHRFETLRPVVVAPRYASLVPGGTDRLVPVDDLFRFRPCDLANVAAALALASASLALVTRIDGLTGAEALADHE